ncbi:MAG: S9 family peptidase [Acidimicrobiaceae bacterium]|nr:prolyl oligopeptidase family serine peptidase [Acidimicrobiaceae bacterium]MDE0515679.1 prolyl oligopeptidase family serine peptidase [Acidimicrobiaceae bacterium]MDE0655264.1 prolyl oligopeptidase family serine peptidase [Acidimicrobiaceae bacterium]MXZ95053.1 S9 family peptidase [Acidimicrobiaceae bacterium]MYF43408.1 S9 family peptidase [Acidimicrobiaceae bacterium]
MPDPVVVPFGEWPSPVTAACLVKGAAGISEVIADPVRPWVLWWAENRPDEGGRTAVMRRDLRGGESQEVTPPDANVRTRVHEYGGGSWWPHDGSLYYVEFADQRLRRTDHPGAKPLLLTAEPPEPRAWRYADGRVTPDGRWSVCVQERHGTGGEPANELVAVATDGSHRVVPLWSGSDFVMTPRVSPDGSMLAWISWDHPNMPWDATRLHVHELGDAELGVEVQVLGRGGDRSLCEPGWDPGAAGTEPRLMVCSDHDDWWGLYEVHLDSGAMLPVVVGDFDVATPPWVFGMQRWAAAGGTVAAVAGMPAGDQIMVDGRAVRLIDSSMSSLTIARNAPDGAAVLAYAGAGYRHEPEVAVVRIDGDGRAGRNAVRTARELGLGAGLLIEPEAITFPTSGDGSAVAHALYYPPANPACAGPAGDRPPLLVTAHGGPTAAARRQLQLGVVFWTSRGIAVVDVDYRGSTGYGRSYRRALDGAWGVADVEDCVAAARFLADRGDVDPQRLIIRGGSAGGFTVLAALALHDTFAAGASRYGIADLEALAADTHKFESRYLDRLVGPYPEARDVYVARSPIHHLDGFDAPMIVLQGDEDEIVPPAQAEMIVEALEAKGVPVAYLLFEGEQHGFRSADNIVAALEAELAFFGRVLGFTPADRLPDLEISGL